MIKLKSLFEGNDYFGMKKSEYDALLKASDMKGYKPSSDKIRGLMSKYRRMSKEDAITTLKLYNSPARNSFTTYDIMNYINKKFK